MMTNDSKDQGREAFEAWWESLPGATGVEADKDYEADVKGWALMSWEAALATSASALARDEASVPRVGAHLWMPAEIANPTSAPQDFGDRKAYAFKAPDAGEHDPWYVVLPNMAALKLGYHADDAIDRTHAEFIAAAINRAVSSAPPAASSAATVSDAASVLTDAQINHMVGRFLGWTLPDNFSPDAGISFKPTFNDHLPGGPMKHRPSGTNLLSGEQAEAMVRYMAEGLVPPSTVSDAARITGWLVRGKQTHLYFDSPNRPGFVVINGNDPVVSMEPHYAPASSAATTAGAQDETACKCRRLGDWKGAHHPLCDRAASSATAPLTSDSEAVGTMDADEREEFERTVEDFEDCGETSTDYEVLMDWAQRGLLECTHFEVTKAGQDLIARAQSTDGEQS